MKRVPEDYRDLITPFHIHRPKFTALVEGLTSAFIGVNDAAMGLSEAFDLDTAIGVQLDIVGLWVGRNRFIPYPLQSFWFSFDDHLRGFDLAVWQAPYEAEFGQYRLADEDFRRLLYAQIGVNYWDGTLESMEQTLIDYYVGGGLAPDSLFFVDDRQDSSATFGVSGSWPPPLIMAMLAWPAIKFDRSGGEVRTRVVSVDGQSMFGFDVSNAYVKGFDQGVWGVPPSVLLIDRGDPSQMDFSNPINSALIGGAT